MFCPKCGKKDVKLIEGLCSSCYSHSQDLSIKTKTIKICSVCKKASLRSKWTEIKDLKDLAEKTIKDQLPKDLNILEASIPKYQKPGINTETVIEIGDTEPLLQIPIPLEYTYCEKCKMKGSQYFEGILQLRNPNKEIIKFIKNDVKKNEFRGVYINKEEEVRGGIDFTMTSRKYLSAIGKKLNKNFKGEMKMSAQHFSEDKHTGKILYRLNVLFRVEDKNDNKDNKTNKEEIED